MPNIVNDFLYHNGVIIRQPKDAHTSTVPIICGITTDGTIIPVAIDASGALSINSSILFIENITTEYTYTGNYILTEKVYVTGSISGAPAKLITYTYNLSNQIIKKEITNTTV